MGLPILQVMYSDQVKLLDVHPPGGLFHLGDALLAAGGPDLGGRKYLWLVWHGA